MNSARPITIVGGGLAGLSLGIALRQREVPVTIWEVGRYPRHRVCGEFLCGRGLKFLERLGLVEGLVAKGGLTATTASFFTRKWKSRVRELPVPALCVSRFEMDSQLAERFKAAGGEIRIGERWSGNFSEEGVVRASGRRVQNQVAGLRWFGLKAHARGVDLKSDLEMHLTKNGYVGLCRIEDGRVNVCGLFWERDAVPGLNERWKEFLSGVPGSPLRECLNSAVWLEESFSSVAGLCLNGGLESTHECRIGDALTMIPPFTGNGMSMSLESAECAMEPIVKYSTGKLDWHDARELVFNRCQRTFQGRLIWANRIQQAITRFHLGPVMTRSIVNSKFLWNAVFDATR